MVSSSTTFLLELKLSMTSLNKISMVVNSSFDDYEPCIVNVVCSNCFDAGQCSTVRQSYTDYNWKVRLDGRNNFYDKLRRYKFYCDFSLR